MALLPMENEQESAKKLQRYSPYRQDYLDATKVIVDSMSVQVTSNDGNALLPNIPINSLLSVSSNKNGVFVSASINQTGTTYVLHCIDSSGSPVPNGTYVSVVVNYFDT